MDGSYTPFSLNAFDTTGPWSSYIQHSYPLGKIYNRIILSNIIGSHIQNRHSSKHKYSDKHLKIVRFGRAIFSDVHTVWISSQESNGHLTKIHHFQSAITFRFLGPFLFCWNRTKGKFFLISLT